MLSHDGWTLRFTAFHFRHIHLCHSSWPSPSRRRMFPRRMTHRRMSPRRSTHGWIGMDVWVNVFTMQLLRADYWPWRKMSRAWPPMSAITTSSDFTCPSHQEFSLGSCCSQAGKGYCGGCYKGHCCRAICIYLLNTSTNIFSRHCPRREDLGRGAVLKSICQVFWQSPTTNTGQEEDN